MWPLGLRLLAARRGFAPIPTRRLRSLRIPCRFQHGFHQYGSGRQQSCSAGVVLSTWTARPRLLCVDDIPSGGIREALRRPWSNYYYAPIWTVCQAGDSVGNGNPSVGAQLLQMGGASGRGFPASPASSTSIPASTILRCRSVITTTDEPATGLPLLDTCAREARKTASLEQTQGGALEPRIRLMGHREDIISM